MLRRREFLSETLGAAIAVASVGCTTTTSNESIRAALAKAGPDKNKDCGILGVVVDRNGTDMATLGSSGVPNVALNADSVFEMGSITKVVTALLLAEMSARGEVAFDDPVAKHLPPAAKLNAQGRPITLVDLASYTSGLPTMPDNVPPNWWTYPNPFVDYTPQKLFAFLEQHVPRYEPGSRYEYANAGFALLGIALAHRAGKSYEDLVSERICNPLGLGHTSIALSADMKKHLVQGHDLNMKPTVLWDLSALGPAGALRTNVKDLIAFLKASMALVQTPLRGPFARLLETRKRTTLAGTEAALGWFISSDSREEIVWKSGLTGGFNTFAGFSTRSRRGALVISNYLWQPLDIGTIELGIKLIDPEFRPGDLSLVYRAA